MRRILITILIMFPLLLSSQALKDMAVSIADVDTFTQLVNGIDAPDKKHDFGNRAKECDVPSSMFDSIVPDFQLHLYRDNIYYNYMYRQ